MPFQWHFIEVMDGFYRFQMITPFTALWFLGVPVGTALALQSVISVLVALAALVVVRSAAPWPLKASVVAFGSVLMVPYVLAYDLAIPLAALVWCLSAGELRADAAWRWPRRRRVGATLRPRNSLADAGAAAVAPRAHRFLCVAREGGAGLAPRRLRPVEQA